MQLEIKNFDTGDTCPLEILRQGDTFGQRSILYELPLYFTAYSVNESRLFYLNKSFFDNQCLKIQGLKEIWENAYNIFDMDDDDRYLIEDYT